MLSPGQALWLHPCAVCTSCTARRAVLGGLLRPASWQKIPKPLATGCCDPQTRKWYPRGIRSTPAQKLHADFLLLHRRSVSSRMSNYQTFTDLLMGFPLPTNMQTHPWFVFQGPGGPVCGATEHRLRGHAGQRGLGGSPRGCHPQPRCRGTRTWGLSLHLGCRPRTVVEYARPSNPVVAPDELLPRSGTATCVNVSIGMQEDRTCKGTALMTTRGSARHE